MFEVAAAFAFVSGVNCRQRVDAMLGAARAKSHDGIGTNVSAHGCASVKRWKVVRRDEQAVPLWDQDRQILFAGDVRIYNRPELAGALGLDLDCEPGMSDLEVAFHAFRAWGSETPRHLVGDFAFVSWDERARVLFAARDHTGMRPLYYTVMLDGILLASDVVSLLPFVVRPLERVNPNRILGGFFPPARQPGETYFRDIRLLQAGHTLLATERSCKEIRYWVPPTPPASPRSYQENCDELLAVFRRSVRDRLESDVPIVAHSSGGFDASTILMVANEAYRELPHRSPLVMASGLTAGFPCDDSRYMEAIASSVGFEWVTWDALEPLADAESCETSLAEPGLRRGLGGGPRRDLEIAKERSARVLLEGIWGDEVLYAGGVFMDMLRGGRWLEVLAETQVLKKPLLRGGRIAAEVLLGALPPATALWFKHRLFGRRQPRPAWLGPALENFYPPPPLELEKGPSPWPSHTMISLWTRLTGPHVATVLDKAVAYGAAEGIEVRFPFADVRLVEHMLSIPWDQRVPQGHLRRTGRDALGPLLPPAFADRLDQRSWTEVWSVNNRRREPFIRDTLEAGPWLSAPFVRRIEACSLLRQARSTGSSDARMWGLLLSFAGLESWLRALSCYNAPAEVATWPMV